MLPARFLATVILLVGVVGESRAQSNPVRLTLTCQQASELKFRLTFENVGSQPTAVVLGMIFGNDHTYALSPLHFAIEYPSGKEDAFDYFAPPAGVGGRVDQWLVALPVGASYSVPVTLPPQHWDMLSMPGTLKVSVTTVQNDNPNSDVRGLAYIRVWTGTLTSVVAFPDGCAR